MATNLCGAVLRKVMEQGDGSHVSFRLNDKAKHRNCLLVSY